MSNRHTCPNLNCQASWGIEEISFQQCDTCGWPDVESEDEPDDDFDDDDFVFDPDELDDDDDSIDPNDSRNL